MRFHLESTSRNKQLTRAIKPVLEQLEHRQLLTIVEGGQTAFYQNALGNPIKVVVEGGGSLAFVGSSVNGNGQAQLNDVPMTIFDTATGQVVRENLGGYGGRDGIERITSVTGAAGNGQMTGAGSAAYEALGTNTLGRTYAIKRTGINSPVYSVVGVNNQNGRVDLLDTIQNKILTALQAQEPEFRIQDLKEMIGADFDPQDPDILYFALNVDFPFTDGTTITRESVPAMFTYDIRSEVVTFNSFFGLESREDNVRIDDFSFGGDGTVYMFGSVARAGGAEQAGLFTSAKGEVVPENFRSIAVGFGDNAQDLDSIAAMEVIDSDYIVVVSDRSDNAELIRIELTDGEPDGAFTIGPVVDPDTTGEVKRGAAIGDLAFNSKLADNFFQPGSKGVLLGTEVAYGELVGIDLRERFPETDVYAVFDAEATTDTSFSMTQVTPDDNDDLSFDTRLFIGVSNPYAASAGTVGTFMVDRGQRAPVQLTLGNGGVFIGGRRLDQNDALTIPVQGLSSSRTGPGANYVGNYPGVRLPAIVNPGIYIDSSINDIYIAGTVSGAVSINGSVDTFYAGNVITGDIESGQELGVDNFFVAGDLRNLIVAGGIGTVPGAPRNFYPGTDFAIGGRVMQMKAGGEFRGTLDVVGKTNSISNRDVVTELETVVDGGVENAIENAFDFFGIANQGFIRNDSFDTPQILGSISDNKGRGGSVTVVGSVNNFDNFQDNQDTYGLPLLAGEGAVVQQTSLTASVRIFDPNGRLYYTDESNLNPADFTGQRLSFTADKPGLWRVVVLPLPGTVTETPYALTVDKIGSISLGGLAAGSSIQIGNRQFATSTTGVRVRNGDLGALLAGTDISGAQDVDIFTGRDTAFLNPILAERGSIRVLEAAAISRQNADLGGDWSVPTVIAKNKIGLLHSDTFLYVNDPSFAVNLTTLEPSKNVVTGGDIQVVEAGGNLRGVLATNGSIGVIRGGAIDAPTSNLSFPSYFRINSDGKGSDELGLIDSAGGIGNFAAGGPALKSGNGGNIRYIRAGGLIYRDEFFGIGAPRVDTATNASITITDDSGAEVSILPVSGSIPLDDSVTGGDGDDTTDVGGDPLFGNGQIPDPFGDGTTVPDPFGGDTEAPPEDEDPVPTGSQTLGTLRIDSYPVRGGGFVIINVESSTGVSIAATRNSGGGIADISRIVVDNDANEATPFLRDENEDLITDANGTPLLDTEQLVDVIASGSARLNIFNIQGTQTGENGEEFSRIINFTDGEIVNLNARSVGDLTAEWIGVSRPVSGVKVEGLNNVADARFAGIANLYPFVDAKGMIFLSNAVNISARGPLGNIVADDGIVNLVANAGNRNVKGVTEGIVAPVVLITGQLEEGETRTINRIEIGEGLAYTGNGAVGFSGIFSTSHIGSITNINGSGDLRGDIVARTYIDRINITGGGSILDSDIYAVDVGVEGNAPIPSFEDNEDIRGFGISREQIVLVLSIIGPSPQGGGLVGVGKINVSGNGGILNTRVTGYNVGKVTADRGSFGVLASSFTSTSGGTMGGISADGLGIRDVEYAGGSFTGDLIATGTGKLRSVDEFSRSARGSESGFFDPTTGIALNAANDLNIYLGTDKQTREIDGVTNEGYIEDSFFASNRSIRSVRAFEIRVFNNEAGARPRDESYPMQINVGGELGNVRTIRSIDGARIVAGTAGTIQSGYDIKNFFLQSSGHVGQVIAKRNMLGSSHINLINSGNLDLLQVGGNLNGTAYAAKGFRAIRVNGNVSSAFAQGGIGTGANINVIDIGGSILSGAYIRAKNTIKSLIVDGNVQSGATVSAKKISSKDIAGSNNGNVS